ncbi:MAG: molybdenum cofactor guanylyltransferase [Candidatus Cloacimonetes bacterium]|nr:molybdenum cofactor guanylyltransferase [Candidatus Cloacimonadota bacterium]
MRDKISGIILAGGNNRRIKLDKAFLRFPINGNDTITLIEITLNKFRKLFQEIIIVSNSPEKFRHLKIKTVPDIIQNKGSLGGIFTGLSEASNERCFITACDMPFLNPKLIKYMLDLESDYDVLIPKTKSGYEPMHAVYSKNCLPVIFDHLESDRLKILNFFQKVEVQELSENDLTKIDDNILHSFFNINTKDEYASVLDQEGRKQDFLTI